MKTLTLSLSLIILTFAAFSQANAQRCFADASAMVGGKAWFINNEPVNYNSRKYVKYGLPRVLVAGDVVPVGSVSGVSVYAEPSSPNPPEVIYLAVSGACEFQPYQMILSPCVDKVTISGKLGLRTRRAVYVFTAAAGVAKGLAYKWSVKIVDENDAELGDADKYVVGGTTGKSVAIATKGLPKKGSIVATVAVQRGPGECTPAEETVKVEAPYR